jgi:hypothetical protein
MQEDIFFSVENLIYKLSLLIVMASKDFNLNMDGYIEQIRSRKSSPIYGTSLKKNKVNEEKVPEGISHSSVYVIKKPKTWWQKFVEGFTIIKEEDFEERPKKEKIEPLEAEQEFEQEMDEMKNEEKKVTFFGWLTSFFSREVEEEYRDMDDEDKIEQGIGAVSEKDTEEIQEEGVCEEKKSFFARVLNFFGLGYGAETIDHTSESPDKISPSIENILEMKEDLKQVAIIATAAFKKLPKEHFKLFKESDDFVKFKEILKKHNIIKEKSDDGPASN